MSLYDVLEQSLPFYNLLRRHMRQTSSLLKSPLPDPDPPIPENKKLLAWVGDEIVPRDSAKVIVRKILDDLQPTESLQCFVLMLRLDIYFYPVSCLRFLCLTRLSKAVIQFGKVFEFMMGRYSSLKSI